MRIKLPRLTDIVREGQRLPKGWGIAYADHRLLAVIAAPVPLHWVIRYARRFWHWVTAAGFKDRQIAFECSAEQKARYVDSAFASSMTLSEWIRLRLDAVPMTATEIRPKEGGIEVSEENKGLNLDLKWRLLKAEQRWEYFDSERDAWIAPPGQEHLWNDEPTMCIDKDGNLQPFSISLRDRFAMIALDRCIEAAADPDVPFGRTRDIASKAYEIADAMMKARKGKE